MLSVYLYNNDPFFYKNIRFAFEAFFNWVETGELRTDSTDKLNTMMWVWPEDVKSWIIGTACLLILCIAQILAIAVLFCIAV